MTKEKLGLPWWLKRLPAMQKMYEMRVQSLDWKDPLEKGMATYSSILAWKIPCTKEPGRLQSMGSQNYPKLKERYTLLSRFCDLKSFWILFLKKIIFPFSAVGYGAVIIAWRER